MRRLSMLAGALVAGGAALGLGSVVQSTQNEKIAPRFGPIGELAGYAWEFDGAWIDGTPLVARNEFRSKMNGQFLEASTIADDGEGPYERYLTIYSVQPGTSTLMAHGFTFDGTVSTLEMQRSTSDDGDAVYGATWSAGPAEMKQEIEMEGDSYAWRVWTRPAGTAVEWQQIMDGAWKRADKLDG
ncbi:MAG: hypothetical protein AAGI17_02130 [Planctomycetota bacterium]